MLDIIQETLGRLNAARERAGQPLLAKIPPNQIHYYDPAIAEKVKTLSAVNFGVQKIASFVNLPKSVVEDLYHEETINGEAAIMGEITMNMINLGRSGDFQAAKLVLERKGGWSQKSELSGPGGKDLAPPDIKISFANGAPGEEG